MSSAATPKQVNWLRSTLRSGLRGTDPGRTSDVFADLALEAILGVPPSKVARDKVGEAVETVRGALSDIDGNQFDYGEPNED